MDNISSPTSGYTDSVVCGPKYNENGFTRGDVNIPGIIGLFVFYAVVLIVGFVASKKITGKWFTSNSTEHIVAGRKISLTLGILTLSATAIGGGLINGTAENVYTPGNGVVWTQAPVFYLLSMWLGGLLFAKKMRMGKYFTIADPIQEKYGHMFTIMNCVAFAMSELLWASSILSALGATLSVIIGINYQLAIIISALIVTIYTLTGGLGSVIYTDVIQLVFVVFGLWLCFPFAITHEAVSPIKDTAWGKDGWIGTLTPDYTLGIYIDSALMLLLGGSTWNSLYQRILSQKTARNAQIMCHVSTAICLILIIPPFLIGAVAKSTDWNATSFRDSGCLPMREEDYKMILPFVLYYLTPFPVAIIGLGAVSAAVMSSCDSAMLSISSMFALNIYRPFRNFVFQQLGKEMDGDKDVLFVLRAAICFFTFLSAFIAITVNSIYGLFFISADLGYVFSFPQFFAAMYIDHSNSYGAIISGLFAYLFRLTAGEPFLNLHPAIKYPWYDETTGIQYFPFKTLSMLLTLGLNISISYTAEYLFIKCKVIPMRFDIYRCFKQKENDDGPQQELEIIKD